MNTYQVARRKIDALMKQSDAIWAQFPYKTKSSLFKSRSIVNAAKSSSSRINKVNLATYDLDWPNILPEDIQKELVEALRNVGESCSARHMVFGAAEFMAENSITPERDKEYDRLAAKGVANSRKCAEILLSLDKRVKAK